MEFRRSSDSSFSGRAESEHPGPSHGVRHVIHAARSLSQTPGASSACPSALHSWSVTGRPREQAM